jgi:hypothetical protein
MKKMILFLAIIAGLVSTGLANIANPDLPGRKKTIDTSLSIRLERDAKEARLVIPRSQLKQLRAELEQLDDATDNTTAGTFQGTQTIVSGALLSLAFVFGGMWFFRSGSHNTKAVAASALLLMCSVATLVYANAGPPPEARSITGKMFSQSVHYYKTGWGKIKLEVSDTARNPELIVPDPADNAAE